MVVEDRELLSRLKLGDITALDTLYTKYRPRLLAAAVSLRADAHLAEDALHDVFISVSARMPHLDVKEPARNNLDFWMPNCTASLAASQSPIPHCSTLHLRFGSIGATKSAAHLDPKMSNLFLADP